MTEWTGKGTDKLLGTEKLKRNIEQPAKGE